MISHRIKKITLIKSALILACAAATPVCAEAAGVEIVPIAVWQGKPARPWSEDQLLILRQKFPSQRIAHAVSAAALSHSQQDAYEFRTRFANVAKPGDDVLLHLAPWKSLVEKNGLAMKYEPTLFGPAINPDDCQRDCGLELSVTAFSPGQIGDMAARSAKILAGAGFGAPAAVYFDQGLVPESYRRAVMVGEISEDWSGIELSQLQSNLSRFPLFKGYHDALAEIRSGDSAVMAGALRMDHVRFGIHAEIADMDSSVAILKQAVSIAKSQNRVVRVPIVFNVEDLIHTHGFVSEFIASARSLISESGFQEIQMLARNSGWSSQKIRDIAPQISVASVESDEAEFYSDEELEAMKNSVKDEAPQTGAPGNTAH